MGKFRTKRDSSDEEDEGAAGKEEEKKAGEGVARRKSAEKDDDDEPAPKPKRGGRMRRADDDDDDDDDEIEVPDWRKKKQQQEEAMKALEAKKRKESLEIEEANTPSGEMPETPGMLARRGKGRTRFDREEKEEDGGEGESLPASSMELFAANPEELPWTSDEVRKKREDRTLFRVGEQGKNALREARDGMREQGLYVARDRVLLPSNIERAIQRVRHRKEAARERKIWVEEDERVEEAEEEDKKEKKGREGETEEEAKERKEKEEKEKKEKEKKEKEEKEKRVKERKEREKEKENAPRIDARTGLEFEADEEPYLMPFDPLKDRICRPSERYDPSAAYMQYDLVIPVQNMDAVLGSADSGMLLELEIARVDLTDHPLFSREDYLAVELMQLARKYQRRAEMKWVELYSQKLEALLAALDTVHRERELASEAGGRHVPLAKDKAKGSKRVIEALVGHGGVVEKLLQEQYLQDEVRHLRLQRAQEEFEDLAIVSRMIEVWEEVKKVRATQKFSSTRVEVKFREKKTNKQQDLEDREAELQAELAEMKKRHQASFDATQAKYIKDKATLEEKVSVLERKIAELEEKEAQAKLGEPVDDDDEDDEEEEEELDEDEAYSSYSPAKKHGKALKPSDGKLALQLALQKEAEKETLQKTEELLKRLKGKEPKMSDNPFDERAAREEIVERQTRLKRPPGDPIYIPVVRDDKGRSDTDAQLSKAEKRRRDKVRGLELVLRVSVNGRLLRKADGRVLEVELQARAGAEFSFKAKETIQLAPTSGLPEIEIHVCEGGIMRGELASVFVPTGEEGLSERGEPLVFQGSKPFELDPEAAGAKPTKSMKRADSDEVYVVPTGEHYVSGQLFLRLNHTNTAPPTRPDGTVSVMVDGRNGVGDEAQGEGGRGERSENRGGMVSSGKLKKMIQSNQLDPNDPRNRHLLWLLSANKEAESESLVRFDALAEGMLLGEGIQLSHKDHSVIGNRWIGAQELSRPAGMRHKLLLARDRNPGAFAGEWPDKAIPVLDREIDEDEVRQDEFYQKVYAVEFPEDDGEDGQRGVDNKQVKRLLEFKSKVQDVVRRHKARQGQRQRRVYRTEDVVHQPDLPTFGAPDIVAAIMYLLRKRSNLRPEEKPVKVTSANPAECRISITVQRAHNLPQRRPEIPAPGQPGYVSATAATGPGSRPVQPEIGAQLECVVQARFGKSVETTPVFKGNNPAWNAHLDLQFEPPNKSWSPSNLMKVSDYLHLNIFDTKVWKKPDVDGQVTKLEKRWLGSIRFPFTTLYTASAKGRIEGVFEIDAPPHIIGYTTVHNQNASATKKPTGGKKEKEPTGKDGPTVPGTSHLKSTLQVCVALDPPLAQPSQRDKELKGRLHGQPELDHRVREWIAECSRPAHCRDRSYDAVGRSLNRDYILATRFVTKEAPPELDDAEVATDERKMTQLCRYVSLIPFLEDFHLEDAGGDEIDHEGLDVWCTSSEFLHFMAGDWEEHATLLCNFFLHLNKTAYLVFGSGIPEGDTVYVMTVEKRSGEEDQVWFWNASRGCKYHSKDDKCTLKEIFYVVNSDNVWGNVQPTKDLTESSFNLKDIKCWRPLFTEKHPASKFQTETVQEKIDWKLNQKNENFVRGVQKDISLHIRNRLEHWRSREGKSLVENEAANRTLTEVLKTMERSAHSGTVFTEEDHHQKLAKFLQPGATSGFNMTGFYINRPYTDPQQIIDEIENADIHHAGPVVAESDVQFAHAVYVRAFPRRVLSLWVAVACLSRKR